MFETLSRNDIKFLVNFSNKMVTNVLHLVVKVVTSTTDAKNFFWYGTAGTASTAMAMVAKDVPIVLVNFHRTKILKIRPNSSPSDFSSLQISNFFLGSQMAHF